MQFNKELFTMWMDARNSVCGERTYARYMAAEIDEALAIDYQYLLLD
jgi:hypothetical protein